MRARWLPILLAVVVTASGCGALNPESLAFAEDETRPGPTVLRLATYTTDGFVEAIEEWEREHPTVEVVLDVRPSDEHHARILEPRSDTIRPDVVALESTHTPSFRNETDLFVELSPVSGSTNGIDSVGWRTAQGRSDDGTIMAVPVDVGGLALAYRADLIELDELEAAESTSWCDLIVAGDAYADRTGNASIAGAADLFEAVLMQSDVQFHDGAGQLIHDTNPAVRRAWNLTMRALGERPLGEDPCPDATDVQRISANLPVFSDEWNSGLRDGDFAAVLAPAWMLDRIQTIAPETSGSWRIAPVPGTAGNFGGTHLAVHAESPNSALAIDLVAYLTAPSTQRSVFDATWHLPVAASLHDDPWLSGTTSSFFGEAPLGRIYIDSVAAYQPAPTDSEFRLILREFRSAVSRVEAGALSPEDAWIEALWRVTQFLG